MHKTQQNPFIIISLLLSATAFFCFNWTDKDYFIFY